MKSLSTHLNEAMDNVDINEAKKSVVNTIPPCPENTDVDDLAMPAINRCYEIAEALEDVLKNATLLKKVKAFKGYDRRRLHDYAVCIEQVGAYINGIMALAEDDIPEAYTYILITSDLSMDYEACLENCAQNIDPADLDSIHDDEDIWEYFEDIFRNWNDVSKAIFGMPWI